MDFKLPVEWPIQVGDAETAYFDLYFARSGGNRYVVGVLGDVSTGEPLVRIESACIFGHVFHGVHCDCGVQWEQAIERIVEEGRGLLIYSVDDDARGHGIETHFDLYVLRQHEGMDEADIFEEWNEPMDVRDYAPVVETLERFDVDSVRLMTNNPERVAVLEEGGIEVVDRVPLEAEITEHNHQLLLDEKEWMGYETSYRTHDEWCEVFRRRADAASRGFMLVGGQRTVIETAFGPDVTPSVPDGTADEFLTLYVTSSMPEDAVGVVADAVDQVVEVSVDSAEVR